MTRARDARVDAAVTGHPIITGDELVDAVVRAETEMYDTDPEYRKLCGEGFTPTGLLNQPGMRMVVTTSGTLDLGTYSTGTYEPVTEVIPAVPPAVVDPIPAPAPGQGRRAVPPARSWPRSLLAAAGAGIIVAGAFLAGQWTTQNGIAPVLPLPVSDVQTAAQTARLWALGTPGEQTQQCGWLATPGDTRGYVLDRWVAHLHAPEGGRLQEVDPDVVAGVLDDACAGRAPGRKG